MGLQAEEDHERAEGIYRLGGSLMPLRAGTDLRAHRGQRKDTSSSELGEEAGLRGGQIGSGKTES